MTLKAVENVTKLPIGNLNDLPDMARRFANELEAERHGKVFRVIVVAETDEDLLTFVWGEDPSTYELIGIFETAKLQANEVFDD